jgi:hypothetical protein
MASVACPYFFPTERAFTIGWAFPHRLPLGSGFCGTCRAANAEVLPDDATLRDFCNLGYARGCSRMPGARIADSLRFAVAKDAGERVFLRYVFEREHAPIAHGRLEYDCATKTWPAPLADACAQRQAECFLAGYLERRRR